MLAEFDPYEWDNLLFVGGVIAMICLYYWNKKRMQDKANARIDRFDTRFPNLTLTYWRDEKLTPTATELSLAENVFRAAKVTWPEYSERSEADFNIWFVRSPEQRVGWYIFAGIEWVDVPAQNRIPAKDPEMGYGGMRAGNTVYVATFIEGRDPEALLVHEFTHAITGIGNDAGGIHSPEFLVEEKKLIAELAKAQSCP